MTLIQKEEEFHYLLALEPEPGDMLTDPQKVFSKAEEMAAKYKQMLFEQTDENEEIPTASAETV